MRPVSAANKTKGWAMAQYLVAQAERLNIQTVIFNDKIWTRRRALGRRLARLRPARALRRPAMLQHRDHVHVDVFR